MNSMKMRTLNTNEVQARMQQEHRYQLFPQIKAQCKPAPYVFQISGVNEKTNKVQDLDKVTSKFRVTS